MTPATHELIRDAFVCEHRGVITLKGKAVVTLDRAGADLDLCIPIAVMT